MTTTTRRTYLGLRPAVAIATGLAAVTIGAAVGLAIPTPLDRCAGTNGATLTVEGCATYLAELDALAIGCGAIAEQLTYERCADDVLALVRSGSAPCGVVAEVEDGVATLVPASCSTADELDDRVATIRDERAGTRWSR